MLFREVFPLPHFKIPSSLQMTLPEKFSPFHSSFHPPSPAGKTSRLEKKTDEGRWHAILLFLKKSWSSAPHDSGKCSAARPPTFSLSCSPIKPETRQTGEIPSQTVEKTPPLETGRRAVEGSEAPRFGLGKAEEKSLWSSSLHSAWTSIMLPPSPLFPPLPVAVVVGIPPAEENFSGRVICKEGGSVDRKEREGVRETEGPSSLLIPSSFSFPPSSHSGQSISGEGDELGGVAKKGRIEDRTYVGKVCAQGGGKEEENSGEEEIGKGEEEEKFGGEYDGGGGFHFFLSFPHFFLEGLRGECHCTVLLLTVITERERKEETFLPPPLHSLGRRSVPGEA